MLKRKASKELKIISSKVILKIDGIKIMLNYKKEYLTVGIIKRKEPSKKQCLLTSY